MLLRSKLLLITLPVLLAPLLMLSAYAWQTERQEERTAHALALKITATQVSEHLRRELAQAELDLRELLALARGVNPSKAQDPAGFRQSIDGVLAKFARQHPHYGTPGVLVAGLEHNHADGPPPPQAAWQRHVGQLKPDEIAVIPAGMMRDRWPGPVLVTRLTEPAASLAARTMDVVLTLPLRVSFPATVLHPATPGDPPPVLWLLDGSRELLLSSSPDSQPWRSSPEELEALQKAASANDLAPVRDAGASLLGLAEPVAAGMTVAVLQAESALHGNTRRLELFILGLLLASLGLSYLILGQSLQSMVVKPLQSLTLATRAFGRGDRGEALVEAARTDEVGALTHALEDVRRHLRESSAEAHRLINADALTGLPNRRYMLQRLEEEIARQRRSGSGLFAVMFIDLDNFKSINDSMGHKAGDRMVIKVAQRLVQAIRAYDSVAIGSESMLDEDSTPFVARLGGDEFLLLVNELKDSDDAARVARRLYEVFDEPISIDTLQINVSMSVGIVCYPGNGETAEQLIKNADVAMYSAKQAGKNQFRFYQSSMEQSARRSLELESGLRRAISGNLLSIHYQPQFSLRTGHLFSAEALVRWWDTERNAYISPGEFVPVAESCGLIHELGNWILVNGLRQLADWNAEGLRLERLALNLSTHQVENDGLADRILDLARSLGIEPRQLEFELTETTVFRHREVASRNLEKLRAAGARLALDDFGTGYSSLAWVHHCKVDAVKIDQSFVRSIYNNPTHQAVVSSVVELCRRLNLDIAAEGIETQQELQTLRRLGCTLAQGYLLGRPVKPEDFALQVLRQTQASENIPMRLEAL